MSESLLFLLRRGAMDSAFQIAATSGVRLLWTLCIPMLAFFVSPIDAARFDVLLVASSLLTIAFTFGLDSGLAMVANTRSDLRRHGYFWTAIAMSAAMALLLYLPLRVAVSFGGVSGVFETEDFSRAYLFGAANGIMVLVFAYFRWIGRSFVAAMMIVSGNLAGFLVGLAALVLTGSVDGFMNGLVAGAVTGALFCAGYAVRLVPVPHRNLRRMRLTAHAKRMLAISWPYGFASAALLSRRALDRGLIMSFESAAVLGYYATVSRIGEILTFALSAPAVGFAPLIIKEYAVDAGRRLARWIYDAYVTVALVCMGGAAAVWLYYGADLFPEDARSIAWIFLPVVAANLIFSQTSVAGLGYVIARKTRLVAFFSFTFIFMYVSLAMPFVWAGHPLAGVTIGFIGASLLHSMLFVWYSERLVSMGYRFGRLLAANGVIAALALIPYFQFLKGGS